MNILIISRDLNSDGGVVNIVDSLISNASRVNYVHFCIGARKAASSRMRSAVQSIKDAVSLFKQVSGKSYDVIHINPSFNMKSLLRDGLFMIILRIARQNVLVFFHGWDEALSASVRVSRLKRGLIKTTFGYGKEILVLADSFRQQLVDMGISESRISLITTMFDGDKLKALDRQRMVNGRTVLFLSRFVAEKGLFELIDAFARLLMEYPDARLIMAGDGPDRYKLEQMVKDHGLSDSVSLPGYLRGDEKKNVLASSDIFVLPTYYGEGCPVSMLEAMAAGLAIISTPVGGIPDVLKDGENGVLLPQADPSLIYQALKKLMSSPELLARMSRVNHEKAWRCYETSVVTAKIEDSYKKAAGQAE